jgi:Holliday junction DNA helicase RuvA
MIEYVVGKLASKKPTEAVVDVNGMGYRIQIPTSTFEQLPDPGKPVRILCHLHVREDAMLLFGFISEAERTTFNLLLGVSGVGPKLALAALSALRPDEIRDRIVTGDAAMLTRIPGVGRKTAERLIVELRDRFEAIDPVDMNSAGTSSEPTAREDALAALEALGLSRSAADKSIRELMRRYPDVTSAEELIRLALRQ